MIYLRPVAVRLYTLVRVVGGRAVPFVAFIYPPTKRKLHRAFHIVGLLVTAALIVEIYRLTRRLPWEQSMLVTASPIFTLLTRWQSAFKWFDERVDKLPIPRGDAVVVENSQLEVTGIHGKGDL